MKQLIIGLVLIVSSIPSWGQCPNSAILVFDSLNKYVAGLDRFSFECAITIKRPFSVDTIQKKGKTFVFHCESSYDTIASFLTFDELGGVGYDGMQFYHLNLVDKKVYVQKPKDKSDILNKKSSLDAAYTQLLFNPRYPAFDLNKFASAILDSFSTDAGNRMMRVTYLDSLPNPYYSNELDNRLVTIKEEYEFQPSSADLVVFRTWIDHFHDPFFIERRFSKLNPIPEKLGFNDVLNIDSLLKVGFELINVNEIKKEGEPVCSISVGDSFPNFNLLGLNGNQFDLHEVTEGIILLDFWYKGCVPCLLAHPFIDTLYSNYKDRGLSVISVNGIDKDINNLNEFVNKRSVHFPVFLDQEKELITFLNIRAYPLFILIEAKTRKVVYVNSGFGDESKHMLEEKILNLLN
ncbi:MAG: TlpA disulfide reductase family protein [Saprospiraceae bacterium]